MVEPQSDRENNTHYNGSREKGSNIMWTDRLKKAWDENPVAVIAVGAFAVTAAAKFIDAVSAAQGRRAYAKQIEYKVTNRL